MIGPVRWRGWLALACLSSGLTLGCGPTESSPDAERAAVPDPADARSVVQGVAAPEDKVPQAAKAVPCAHRKECMILGRCTIHRSASDMSTGCRVGEDDCATSTLCKELGWCTRATFDTGVYAEAWCVDEATAAEMKDGRPWLQAQINLADPTDRGGSAELFPALWKQIAPIRSCMRDGAVAVKDMRYLVIATVVVDARGRAKKSSVRRYEPEQATMDACVETALRSMTFKGVPASETTLEFDFETLLDFRPAGMPYKLERQLWE